MLATQRLTVCVEVAVELTAAIAAAGAGICRRASSRDSNVHKIAMCAITRAGYSCDLSRAAHPEFVTFPSTIWRVEHKQDTAPIAHVDD